MMNNKIVMNQVLKKTFNEAFITAFFQPYTVICPCVIYNAINTIKLCKDGINCYFTCFWLCKFSNYLESLSTLRNNFIRQLIVVFFISSYNHRNGTFISQ